MDRLVAERNLALSYCLPKSNSQIKREPIAKTKLFECWRSGHTHRILKSAVTQVREEPKVAVVEGRKIGH